MLRASLDVSRCRAHAPRALALRVALVGFLMGASVLAVGAQSKAWTPPKTPWGDPDLQGIWPGNVGVPMQRPANLGERTTLTDQEFAQKEAQSRRQAEAD